jgi:hypothetical protein
MTASCSYDGPEPRLSGSDPHGAIQISSFGGKMKIVKLWLMPAPSTLPENRLLLFGARSKMDVSANKASTIRVILLQHAFSVG